MFSVRQKIFIARSLNLGIRTARRLAGLGMHTVCRRRGIDWELDLDEGIDLAIYLQGAYEPRTVRAYSRILQPGATVFDIGANVGAHTLHFARLVGPSGRVLSFEPTEYAVEKLQRNLARNPALARQVLAHQMFLVADESDAVPAATFSSWPVGAGAKGEDWGHLGRKKGTRGASAATADSVCRHAGIDRIDLVKIDTDGNELAILRGFRENLARFKPVILIELAPYIYQREKAREFDDLIAFLAELGYRFTDSGTGRAVPENAAQLRRFIVPGGGINALLFAGRAAT